MIDGYQTQALATPLQIPMIYGIDSVHGDNNLAGATVFPHNIGMGATRDPALAQQEGIVTATETRATGIPWAFSRLRLREPGRALGPVLRVLRRGPGAGRPDGDHHRRPAGQRESVQEHQRAGHRQALPRRRRHQVRLVHHRRRTRSTRASPTPRRPQLDALYLDPFKTAVDKGVGSVMPSYSSLQIVGKDAAPIKMHARGDQITGVLKGQLGFSGLRHQRLRRASTRSARTTRTTSRSASTPAST